MLCILLAIDKGFYFRLPYKSATAKMASNNSPLLFESCVKSIDSEADSVSNYYGEVLQQSSDLQTNACCTIGEMPDYMKKALNNIHDDVMMKYYGCGLVHPECLIGASICDLGCGAGRDCYVLSQLVGEQGSVTGIDFNDEQLKVSFISILSIEVFSLRHSLHHSILL